MKNTTQQNVSDRLNVISIKYTTLDYNKNNFDIGGGLAPNKFASNRHQDAKKDQGKLTLGEASQLFKKATKDNLTTVKKIIKAIIPHMEWHHAGKLPKQYGGGMKKTYFLKSHEICEIANKYLSCRIELEKKEKTAENLEKEKIKFENKWAEKLHRIEEKPKYFHVILSEYNGKYGFFPTSKGVYNLTEYFTGLKFRSKKKLKEYQDTFVNKF
ncbi:hypothetical protein [Tenacibaculum maritimum]|uniref:hypothetical protein n=1 Tax=Tenacibaculum maritimum TaxID=107401 RepID=UPI0012E5C60F|nr:hypothetical protein [Tenacibaculum maritimum]CAA0186941.1 conserved hypothetical protein [Tenacibaculum maritimum]CAA0221514.1 conserved hypothetical protein [Tenacibaculum maritimum]